MNKEKLLVFHPALAPYRIDFFNELNNEFDALFYFFYENVPNQNFDQEKLVSGLNFCPRYLKIGFNLAGRPIRTGVISIIDEFNPDVVIVSEFGQVSFQVVLIKHLLSKKFKIYTISDDSLDNAKNRKGFRKIARKLIVDRIEGIIFPSEEVSKWFNENVSSKTKTLQLPIIHEDEQFRFNIENSLAIANENINRFNLKEKKVILYVGRLADEKNISFLIQAFSEMRLNESMLVIVGDGPLKSELKDQVLHLAITDKVIFTGRKEGAELYSWYAVGQIFVLPSTYEPFGAVVNEALLAGCYVLVSTKAGASTLVDGNNGDLFSPYNKEELKVKMNRVLEQTNTISKSGVRSIRINKMPFRFKEKIMKLIHNL